MLVVATEAIYEKVKNYPGKVRSCFDAFNPLSYLQSAVLSDLQVGKVESIICLDASVDKPYSYKQ